MRKLLDRRLGLLSTGCLAVLVVISVLLPAVSGNGVSRDARYDSYLDRSFSDLGEMCSDFCSKQEEWIQLVPPGMPYLVQGAGIQCFKESQFPKEFVRGLVAVQHEGYETYPVVVFEDYETRDYVFVNAKEEEFYSVAAPDDYDPLWLLYRKLPNIDWEELSRDEVAELIQQYDPVRVAVRYELITKKDLATHLEQISQPPEEDPPGPIIMRAYEGPPVTNIQFTSIEELSNGVIELTIAYPNGFTNSLDIFSCDTGTGLMDFWWDLQGTTNINASTNWIEWTDTDATNANGSIRFYVAANADINAVTDPDDDGLTWGREKYMYHTCPTNDDTDADGYDDYEEVITYKTDPNNNDTSCPSITIDLPTNNFERTWMP